MKRTTLLSLLIVTLGLLLFSPEAAERSPRWRAVRNAFIRQHPACIVCGRPATQIHHVIPFSRDPGRELDPSNLVSLCDRDHLLFGHLDSFRSYNPTVREDAAEWRARINHRPPAGQAETAYDPTTPTLTLRALQRRASYPTKSPRRF